jgi:pimeloyl-ACP methyl ester carboxylesterase
MLAENIKLVRGEAMMRFLLSTYAAIVTLPQPRSPVLLVVGQRETPPARMMARCLEKAVAGSRGVIVPRGSQLWNLQQPVLFNALVRAWVCNLPSPQEMKS